MKKNKSLVVVGSSFYSMNYSSKIYRKIVPPISSWLCKALLSYISPVNVGTAMWRRTELVNSGGFSSTEGKIEGFTTLKSISKFGSIGNVKEALYVYNIGVKKSHRSEENNYQARDLAMVTLLKKEKNYLAAFLWRCRSVIAFIFPSNVIRLLTCRRYIELRGNELNRIKNYPGKAK